jgi:hypothetical protein
MTFGLNSAVQALVDELADDDDFAPPPTPASAAAAAAAARRDDAARKRKEREARRAEGLPDPRVVDVAIVQALAAALKGADARGHMSRTGSLKGLSIPAGEILSGAMRALRDKGLDRHVAGRLLQGRLLP